MKTFSDRFKLPRASFVLLIVSLTTCSNNPEPTMTAFRGTFSATTTVLASGVAGSLDRCSAHASDGEYPGLSASELDDATGEFNVLGPVTIVSTACIDQERGSPTQWGLAQGTIARGRAKMRTASGEVLMTEFHGSWRATANSSVWMGASEHQVVGGTGRFAQAHGTFVCELRISLNVFPGGAPGSVWRIGDRSTHESNGNCQGYVSL